MRIRDSVVFISLFTISALPASIFSQATPAIRVPFVGCESDGQVGPVAAPKGTEMAVQVDGTAVKKLAYYKAEYSPGVLAPKGWNCFCMYGSNGAILLVAPQPLKMNDLFPPTWGGIIGPGIQVTVSEGQTSGRFDVARMIARVFPKERAFVQRVINEKIEPASDFPFGPYPKDKLVHKSHGAVEYHTPPNSRGLGTKSRLQPNDFPIDGVAILTEGYNLIHVSVRLPADMDKLAPSIIQQFERENVDKEKR
jgi:hypothetical protein